MRKLLLPLYKLSIRLRFKSLRKPKVNKHKAISQVAVGALGFLLFAPALSASSVTEDSNYNHPLYSSATASSRYISAYSGFLDGSIKPIETLQAENLSWPTTTTRITRGVSGSGTITNNRVSASSGHTGVDIDCETGDAIFSVMNGTVIVAASGGPFGNKVMVEHEDTDNNESLKSMYAHLNTMAVTPGQEVSAGDFLGTCGETGNSSGDHLHWEMYINNTVIDPLGFYYEAVQ